MCEGHSVQAKRKAHPPIPIKLSHWRKRVLSQASYQALWKVESSHGAAIQPLSLKSELAKVEPGTEMASLLQELLSTLENV